MVQFYTTQWCHGSVRFRYGGGGGGAIGYVAMLEIFLFKTMKASQWISHKHAFAPWFAHLQT